MFAHDVAVSKETQSKPSKISRRLLAQFAAVLLQEYPDAVLVTFDTLHTGNTSSVHGKERVQRAVFFPRKVSYFLSKKVFTENLGEFYHKNVLTIRMTTPTTLHVETRQPLPLEALKLAQTLNLQITQVPSEADSILLKITSIKLVDGEVNVEGVLNEEKVTVSIREEDVAKTEWHRVFTNQQGQLATTLTTNYTDLEEKLTASLGYPVKFSTAFCTLKAFNEVLQK